MNSYLARIVTPIEGKASRHIFDLYCTVAEHLDELDG